MSGNPTVHRYTCATSFVDHFTDFTYLKLQHSTGMEETITGKEEFEKLARENGITILAYHADNGVFASNQLRDHFTENNQQLTFSGVNAHHQNGLAERKIREIQDMTRTMLIHANHKWPSAISKNLWPYAARLACDALNNEPVTKKSSHFTPEQLFSGSSVATILKHQHPFGEPTYVLAQALQGGPGIFHK